MSRTPWDETKAVQLQDDSLRIVMRAEQEDRMAT
jgi:hypothetical protein